MQPNGIGQFIIGESPIGDQPFDWTQTLYSQYANSDVMIGWLTSFSGWIDANQQIDAFYDQEFNIATAVGYGLDVWGRILGIGRVLFIDIASPYVGFAESGDTNYKGWNQAPWYNGESLVGNYALSDDAYRVLLMAKAAANIWDGSTLGLNRILRILFPGQVAYVTDNLNMTMHYVFGFTLTAVQSAIINSGVLPRPSGVAIV
jgi:hypothetical protein